MARIMVVDDNFVMRRNLTKIITELGHKVVVEAENGQQALIKYREKKPDLVTMDITMPNMNGIDALERLKKINPSAKVVMISAMGQKGKVLKAMELGASHFIVKPVRPEKVEEIFAKILDDGETRKEKRVKKNEVHETFEGIQLRRGQDEIEIKVEKIVDEEIIKNLNFVIKKYLSMKDLKIKFFLSSKKFKTDKLKEEFQKILRKIQVLGGKCEVNVYG